MFYKKISVEDRLPEIGKFVTTIDSADQHRVYRWTGFGWNMRDINGINSPNDNTYVRYWLEEVDLSKTFIDAKKYEVLRGKLYASYDESTSDVCSIGELTLQSFGLL